MKRIDPVYLREEHYKRSCRKHMATNCAKRRSISVMRRVFPSDRVPRWERKILDGTEVYIDHTTTITPQPHRPDSNQGPLGRDTRCMSTMTSIRCSE